MGILSDLGFDGKAQQREVNAQIAKIEEQKKKLLRAASEYNYGSVHVYKSLDDFPLLGKGSFAIAKFMFPQFGKQDVKPRGYVRAMTHKTFCFFHENKSNDLSGSWSNASIAEFDIWKVSDYQKAQKWYETMRKRGYQISPFFSPR